MTYRIDIITTNYMVNLQKQALDILFRRSFQSKFNDITKLRDLLLFDESPRLEQDNVGDSLFDRPTSFDLSQLEAIRKALNMKNMLFIQGPPGTGKTTIISEIIDLLVKEFHKKKLNLNLKDLPKNIEKSRVKQKIIHNLSPVLITAFTNKAVDNLIHKLYTKNPDLKIVRLGNIASMDDPIIIRYALEENAKNKVQYSNGDEQFVVDPMKAAQILENADVIAATTTMAGSSVIQNLVFDTVIVDEAGQITEPSALIPLLKGTKFILVGDHQQLPPIVVSKVREIPNESKEYMTKLGFDPIKGLEVSIFERLINHYHDSPCFILLKNQYRMNKIICDFISKTFYSSQLSPGVIQGKNIGDQTLEDLFKEYRITKFNYDLHDLSGKYFLPSLPMVFLDTINISALDSAESKEFKDFDSCFNEKEAIVIGKLIRHFLFEISQNKLNPIEIIELMTKIGIISGYRAQNLKIRQIINKELKQYLQSSQYNFSEVEIALLNNNLIIDTVDRFQGQEREIIIYSFVDSNKRNELRTLNQEIRRLNVATSRAKKKIIFVGNSQTLTQGNENETQSSINAKHIHRQLIQFIKDNKGYFIENII